MRVTAKWRKRRFIVTKGGLVTSNSRQASHLMQKDRPVDMSNIVNWLALSNICEALIIAGLAVPMVLRKVPMNRYYGARMPQSYRSDANWYAINEMSGKYLIGWSLPILALGLYGLLATKVNQPVYVGLSVGITFFCVLAAVVQTYLAAQAVDRQNGGTSSSGR